MGINCEKMREAEGDHIRAFTRSTGLPGTEEPYGTIVVS